MIPDIFEEIVQHLKDQKIELVKRKKDPKGGSPRRDSADSKGIVMSSLRNKPNSNWQVIPPSPDNKRNWYDFICTNNKTGVEYYCNIKISNLKSNDNMNAKKSIYWLLTGKNPEKVPDQNAPFFKSMKDNENLEEDRDFYYLVINKNNTEDIFIVSLKNINTNGVNSSHNNPPIQADWDKCRKETKRDIQGAKIFLLDKWACSITKHLETLSRVMPKYYPEYFKGKKVK